MMWLVTLMIFLSVGGSLCDSDSSTVVECFEAERDQNCDRALLPSAFPVATEELRNICRNVQSAVGCIRDAKEKCEYTAELPFIRKFLVSLESICDEDNPIFTVISHNLQCIAENARGLSEFCIENLSMKSKGELETFLEPYAGEHFFQDIIKKCLYFRLDVSCHAVNLGYHCGTAVQDAVEHIMLNLYNHPQVCEEKQKVVGELKTFFESILIRELDAGKKLNERIVHVFEPDSTD